MTEYNKDHPFPAKIKERVVLNKEGSSKKTYHIALDLKDSHITYKVGDALGIFPSNIESDVNELLNLLKKTGEEPIIDPRTQTSYNLKDYLTTKVNLFRITSSLLKLLQTDLETNDLLTLFKRCKSEHIPIQELISHFAPMLPRLYSIASAQSVAFDEAHLLISTFTYQCDDIVRPGLTSHFLTTTEKPIPIYLHPTKTFTLPQDISVPIIMIAAGTGIAPYRGFLQERMHQKASTKNYLIFGEREATDFYYEDYFRSLEKQKHLHLDLAFSRVQENKVYVQHKLQENSSEIIKWLEEGAYLYVCGDKQMAKDVNTTLHHIVNDKAYIKNLRKEKRYLVEAY